MPAPRYLLLGLMLISALAAGVIVVARGSSGSSDASQSAHDELTALRDQVTRLKAQLAERSVTGLADQAAAAASKLPASVAAQIAQIGTPPEPMQLLMPDALAAAVSDPADSKQASDPTLPKADRSEAQQQVALLQKQVEYLQNQVSALEDENSGLLDQLAGLGMKPGSTAPAAPGAPTALGTGTSSTPMAKGAGGTLPDDFTPETDYIGLGADLIAQRKLEAAPLAAMPVTVEEVEPVIFAALTRWLGADHGKREGAAFAALGAIPEAVDTLPLKAALLARQLAGWYNDETETLLVVEAPPGTDPILTRSEPVIAIAYGTLWSQFSSTLFGTKAASMSTDERLARLSLLGGDAAQMRLLHQLQNPNAKPRPELPLDDPEHPINQVPMPAYLRSLATLPLTEGLQFAQALHSIGGATQLNASYRRPPVTTAEVLDTERYFADVKPPDYRITWQDTKIADTAPLWDDTLGMAATIEFLRRYNADDAARTATHGWQTDRWLAYPSATLGNRGHVVWRTQWQSLEDAQRFFVALRECLIQQYRQPSANRPDDAKATSYSLRTNTRQAELMLIAQPQPSVLYLDAGEEAFAAALRSRFVEQK